MIEAIVLAAGFGTRMGRTKPLLDIDGRPALTVVLDRIRAAGIPRPILVLGHGEAEIRASVDLSEAQVVTNPHPEQGMGTSLAVGLVAVSKNAMGAVVFHADMPFIESETVRSVLSAATSGARIAAPAHEGRRGFPVFFHRSCFSELRTLLGGEEGGCAYLRVHSNELVLVDVDDSGCVTDLDRFADLARGEGGPTCATLV